MKRITLFLFLSLFISNLFVLISFAAGDGSVSSTVEINSLTANGPTLSNSVRYGNMVADIGDLNGDGVVDIAVNSRFGAGSGSNQGDVHISFLNIDGSVDSTVKIDDNTVNGPTVSDNDGFGTGIASIGDLNGDGVQDLAIGAVFDDEGGTDRGAVHILFMNTDGSVDSTVEINSSTLNGPVLSDSDYFGGEVAALGDLNGDGVEDIAVGAGGDNGNGTDRGAVHILYLNTDGSVDSTVEINDSTANGPVLNDSDGFGNALENIGDLNGDGVIDLAVGATGDDEGGSAKGAVHIMFMNTDGSVDSTVEINASTTNGPQNVSSGGFFGNAIATPGDLNGDGVQDLVVGQQLGDVGGTDRGLLHIFFMNTDGSVDSTVEINSNTTNGPTLSNGDYYGVSIASLGDLDGNGGADLLVGAWKDDAGGGDRGTVHIHFMTYVESEEEVEVETSSGSGGMNIDVDASCSISDTTIKEGEEIDIEIDIEATKNGEEIPYTFKWTKVLEGTDEETSHTFDTEGEYTIKGQVKTEYKDQTITCDTITVSENKSSNTSSSDEDEEEEEDTDTDETSSFSDIIDKYKDFLTTLYNLGVTLPVNVVEMLDVKSTTSTTTLRDLELGMIGDDVKSLQVLLISNGYDIPAGATRYFGEQTKQALIEYQTKNNISPAQGYFGPTTRTQMTGAGLEVWW